MGSVRNRLGAAWVPFEPLVCPVQHGSMRRLLHAQASAGGTPMNFNTDWFYIVMTIVAFGVLWLIVKGVERFER